MPKPLRELLAALEVEHRGEPELHVVLIEESSDAARYEVDYGAEDEVFDLAVTRVRRRRLGVPDPAVVARLEGVDVSLVSVALADQVEVTLDAGTVGPSPSSGWEAWPAELITRGVTMTLADDAATRYRFTHGEAGGESHPWRVHRRFLPLPPPRATVLRLGFTTADHPPVTLSIPLR